MVRGARGAHNRCAASVYSSTSSTFDMRFRGSTVVIRILCPTVRFCEVQFTAGPLTFQKRCRVSSEWYADPHLTSLWIR
jgi:hypothetical protein